MSALLLAASLSFAPMHPAQAHEEARRRGDCTGASEWRLIVRPDDASKLLVRFRIEGGREGETWQLFLSDDGEGVFAGDRTSRDGGRVAVRRRIRDRIGDDRIKASGVNLDSGETCAGRVTF